MNQAMLSSQRLAKHPTEESQLVEIARQGDLDSFNQLVLSHQNLVFHHIQTIVRDDQLADDLTQTTFIKAYQAMPGYRNGSFRGWLLRIATNTCYDELRRQKRNKTQPLTPLNAEDEENESPEWLLDPSPAVEQQVERKELSVVLRACLNQLPAEFRTMLELVDVMGLDYAEASQALSVPIGTVKSRLARGRLRMQEMLKGLPN